MKYFTTPMQAFAVISLLFLFACNTDEDTSSHSLVTDTVIGEVHIKDFQIEGSTYNSSYQPYPSERYGRLPYVAYTANPDNSVDVAFLDAESQTIRVISINQYNKRTTTVEPTYIGKTTKFLGFTKVSGDNSYAAAYSKPSSNGNQGFEYWITRFDKNGTSIFNTRIFGSKPADETWAKGAPGRASSSRLAFNQNTNRIGFYLGHTMKWDDGVRHQGGYISFLNLEGQQLTKQNSNKVYGDTWYFSHNFDQRMLVSGRKYVTLAHGDAYPRALGFATWNDDTTTSSKELQTEYFQIPGETGNNTTHTETGGIVALNDGNFGVVFASSIDRTKRDVCFKKFSPEGEVLLTKWLTSNNTYDAFLPRIARRGKDRVFIAWAQYANYKQKTQFIELNYSGKIVAEQQAMPEIKLQPFYNIINLPNGDIVWATETQPGTLTLYRIKP